MKKSGIYKIINIVNRKLYIGSSVNIASRWAVHRLSLRNNKRKNIYLQNAWNKYGEQAFKFEIIELITDKNKLIEKEQYWMNYYRSYERDKGYNSRIKAETNSGHIVTEEQKHIISTFMKKIPRTTIWKQRIGKAHEGKTLSIEHAIKLKIAAKKIILERGSAHKDSWKKKVSEETITNLYNNGYTVVGIAKLYRMQPTLISRILKNHGIVFRPHYIGKIKTLLLKD